MLFEVTGMFKPRVLLSLALVLLGAFAYHTFTNITRADIFAYHRLEREAVGASFASAGDVVAISPDGTRMEAICLFDLDAEVRREAGLDSIYVNDLGRQLPTFPKLMNAINFLTPSEGDGRPDETSFAGKYSELSSASAVAPAMTRDCECEMARRMNRREKVCTTIAALSEARDGRALAIRFATYANFVTDARFEECGLEKSPAALALDGATCSAEADIPWDVKLRAMLRLIEQHPRKVRAGEDEARTASAE